jgi:hypothetical protein
MTRQQPDVVILLLQMSAHQIWLCGVSDSEPTVAGNLGSAERTSIAIEDRPCLKGARIERSHSAEVFDARALDRLDETLRKSDIANIDSAWLNDGL